MLSIQKLHEQIKDSVLCFQNAEAELLTLLNELDERRGYLDLGFASL